MSKGLSQADKEWIAVEGAKRIFRRLAAASTFYTGQLGVFRTQALKDGDPPWRIIRYPRIINPEQSFLPLAKVNYVRPNIFERQLAYLARHCRVIPLDELIKEIENSDPIRDGTVALTFDCGWEDHYRIASKGLLRYQLPATFFLPTDFVGTNNMFWHDKLVLALLVLKENKQMFPDLEFLDEDAREGLKQISPKGEITLPLISVFIDLMKSLDVARRLQLIAEVGLHFNAVPDVKCDRLFMTWEETEQLNSIGLFTFGSQGHTHRPLNELTREEVAVDLRESYVKLNNKKLKLSKVFCYPDGLVTKEARKTLSALGIQHSVAFSQLPVPNLTSKNTRVFGRVPMFQDAAFSVDVFACRLWGVRTWGYGF